MDRQYPYGGPGYYDAAPETSRIAAECVASIATVREAAALEYVRSRAGSGATADEVAEALEWDRYSSRPRLSTLRAKGKIEDSGKRRRGVSGRMQAVWVLPKYVPVSMAGEAA